MVEEKVKIIPTGITSLDGLVGGGFPAGSFVVLFEEMGAGAKEFSITSSMMLGAIKAGRLKRSLGKNIVLPKKVLWAMFTRAWPDLMREVESSFDRELYEFFNKHVESVDFSEDYFVTSSVPLEWISAESAKRRQKEALGTLGGALTEIHRLAGAPVSKPKGILSSLADFLTDQASSNVVFLYTLTDLARLYSDSEEKWYEFALFIRGLQRATKKWGGIVYANFNTNLLDKRMEEEIALCADGVLSFEWARAGPTQRRRTLEVKKFSGLLSYAKGAAMRFEVDITPSAGLQVIRPELVEGLRA